MRAIMAVIVLSVAGLAACTSEQSPADGPPADVAPLDDASPDTAEPPTGPDPLSDAELWRVVSKLASDELAGREEGSPGGASARAFLIEELKRCGVGPAAAGYEQRITTGQGTNVLGLVKGTDSARAIVVSAHYDHLGECGGAICNGAYDNAAGVTLVLGVACALARQPARRSVLVALWDAEEPPTYLTDAMGSEFYAAHPVVPLAETDAAIVLDLIGSDVWPGAGLHFVLGGELSPEVAAALGDVKAPAGLTPLRLGLHLVENLPTGGGPQPWSDYDAFRDRGVPVLFLSDGYNKRYHQPDDEVDKLVRAKLPLEAAHLLAVVRALANASPAMKKNTFDAQGADYALDAAGVEATLAGAVAPGGLAGQLSPASKSKLQDDLSKVKQIKTKLGGGAAADAAEITVLRRAVQRVMCYTGPQYPEALCNMF